MKKAVRLQTTVPPEWLDDLQKKAEEAGHSISSYIRLLIKLDLNLK